MKYKQDDLQSSDNTVTLYDQHGNPVQVDAKHVASPEGGRQQQFDSPDDYNDAAREAFNKQVHSSSHVTSAPESHEGHNFNPQVRSQYANEPKVVHSTRPIEPEPFNVSDEVMKLHEQSVKDYPQVNLSAGEYVIHDVYRHPIGMFIPVGVTIGLILFIVALIFSFPVVFAGIGFISFGWFTIIAVALILLIALFGYIAVWVYTRNRLILTNESVIQEIQHSLFSKHEQTVSLGSVEDASYRQNGIIEMAFNYGSIRLSTEGEETTYRFYYVENPKRQVAILTNAVEAFKNGRPVTKDLLK